MKRIILLGLASMFFLTTFAQRYTGKDYRTSEDKLNDEYCSGLFKTHEGIIFDLQNENESAKGYSNILDWLSGRVAGLQLYYTRYGTPVPFIRNTRSGIFVDEIAVDPAFLNTLPVTDIAMIKVIKEPFIGAIGNGAGGTIAIYTIKGDDDEETDEGK
jgi:hypothetical protein